jgi:glucose 1-dehydrogenase
MQNAAFFPNRFQDKVCLISGAGSGIGKATALRMGREGAKVLAIDLKPDAAQATSDEIIKNGGEAIAIEANVGESKDVQNAVNTAVAKWKKIDVVVNDAAMMTFTPIVDLAEEDWYRVMKVNIGSVFLFTKYAVPHMPAGANIVNISSVHAHETTMNVVPYATSKGAMEAFTRGMSIELESRKIRINSVAPGAVNTPMLWNNPNVKSGAEIVSGAIGEPEDLAAAICFIASDDARFVNGTTLVVDGARLDIL